MKLHGSLNIKGNDLYIGDIKISHVAERFKTPCYLMDENLIRDNLNRFKNSMGLENVVVYAGKTFLNSYMVNILKNENVHLDVVSEGELYIAKANNFPMNKVIFHGSNKSLEEINMGVTLGVSRFVCDSISEIELIETLSKKLNKKTSVFLRINPGIDAHTHEYIKTACVDCKFGIYNDKNIIANIISKYSESENIEIVGFHYHIGSQIFSIDAFKQGVDEIFKLICGVKEITNFQVRELNLGGGFGIYYTDKDTPSSIEDYVKYLKDRVEENCNKYDLKLPKLYIEPGRSVVGNAGSTLYKVGNIKEIEGIRNYVSVDGGMTDNIRTALYGAEYECIIANKASEEKNYKATISGKCCESGDVVARDVNIAKPNKDDLLVVFSTGAYCHSMSSNYNKIRKAPIVFYHNNKLILTTKREELEDLIKLDCNE